MRQTSKVIAIIDEDESMQRSLQHLIESAGLVARCFGSAEEYLESNLRAACVIAEIRMPRISGLELQARLKEEDRDVRIIFITAHGDSRIRVQAMRSGAVEFLTKPVDDQVLLKTLQAALDM
jgi:FixJ family two-component response regulator